MKTMNKFRLRCVSARSACFGAAHDVLPGCERFR